jgi:hypothetical protein
MPAVQCRPPRDDHDAPRRSQTGAHVTDAWRHETAPAPSQARPLAVLTPSPAVSCRFHRLGSRRLRRCFALGTGRRDGAGRPAVDRPYRRPGFLGARALRWAAGSQRRRCVGLVLALALSASGAARSQSASEYEVKSAFIANFAKFIEWPPEAFERSGPTVVVCVAGQGPLESGLGTAIDGHRVGERALRTERLTESSRCHILFVGASGQKRFAELIRSVDDRTVTIGEDPRFLEAGGAIAFRTEGHYVRFDINLEVVKQGRYSISSKLLALARKADPAVRP